MRPNFLLSEFDFEHTEYYIMLWIRTNSTGKTDLTLIILGVSMHWSANVLFSLFFK